MTPIHDQIVNIWARSLYGRFPPNFSTGSRLCHVFIKTCESYITNNKLSGFDFHVKSNVKSQTVCHLKPQNYLSIFSVNYHFGNKQWNETDLQCKPKEILFVSRRKKVSIPVYTNSK